MSKQQQLELDAILRQGSLDLGADVPTLRGPNEWDYPVKNYERPLPTCTGSSTTFGPWAKPELAWRKRLIVVPAMWAFWE